MLAGGCGQGGAIDRRELPVGRLVVQPQTTVPDVLRRQESNNRCLLEPAGGTVLGSRV